RKWNYEPKSLTSYTSDPSKIKIVTKINRVRRGDYAISAKVEWKYAANALTMIEAIAYRSSSGAEADYKLLPWSIPKQPFYEYLDNYYKDVIMKMFSHCTNLPQFEGKFQPPWPSKTYVIDKCVLGDGDGLPEVVPPGFYKIVLSFSGTDQPSWGAVAILKITPKIY
ncbi:hypothetical protein KR200_003252, partial [Drosophila serrata]